MKLFVGNLPFSISEDSLLEEFSAIGQVLSARIITDRETGRPRGFGFVEMANQEEGNNAISQLNGRDFDGRQIAVSEAKPQVNRGGYNGGGRRDRY